MSRSASKLYLRKPVGRLPACIALACIYVIAGRLGLLLAVPPGYATAIFPPAGIAVAAMFIGGSFTLPWTFLGSLTLNLWVGAAGHGLNEVAADAALIIAAASTLQAACGGWAFRRLIGYPAALDNGPDVARFFLGAPFVCLISATLSLGGMALMHAIDASDIGASWFVWWMGDTLGVLLFLPITMLVAGEPRTLWAGRAGPLALPMLVFFAFFVAVFVRIGNWQNEQSLMEFRLLSQQVTDKLRAQLTAQEIFLEQLRTSFSGPARLSRQDFAARAHTLLTHFPPIQAIGWAPRVPAADRATFEAAQQHDAPGFTVREQTETGALRPAALQAEAFPILYVEPLASNQIALGFDLASEPVRRAAVLGAIATGELTASAPTRLLQLQAEQSGLLLTAAVPKGPNGAGIVFIALRITALMNTLLAPAQQQLGVELIDQEAQRPLFDTIASDSGGPALVQKLAFGERQYQIRITPTALYFQYHREWQSWAVLVIGVLSTSLLGALLMLATGERQRFARLLTERTRERDRIWQVSEDLLGVGNFEGYFTSVNPAWTLTLGWTEAEIKTIHVNDLRHPDDYAIGMEGRRRLAEGVPTVRMENRFRHKDGSYRWLYWTMTAEQGLIYVIGRNVTADRETAEAHQRIEEQLRQLQKMESVGQLTGGIAHDFNNLLTIIIGNLEILDQALGTATDRARRAISAAMTGAMRAATLTQRLMAYAQKQPLRPRALDLNELIQGMAELIRRTQGETIQYEFSLSETPPHCFCDFNQLENALLNLVINARDAMPEGGRLRIATNLVEFDAAAARVRGIAPGGYVLLEVSDTGTGMSPETAARAFEPFFTTKEIGKGTGLGLSMVYGFAKQSKGHVEIDSAIGRGTTVRIYLPAIALGYARSAPDIVDPAMRDAGGHGETILVVEDDAEVRLYVADTLRALNYRVIDVAEARSALETLAEPSLPIDLLLTDVVMPGLDGRELVRRAAAMREGLKVLYMTGYSQDAIVHQGRLDPDVELIEKPFRRESLAARVRGILDAHRDIQAAAS